MKGGLAIAAASIACLAAAGCSSPDGDGGASGPTSVSASSPDLDGVVLEVVRSESGDAHRLDATVRNTGLYAFYFLWVPSCGLEPWTDSLAGPDGPVEPREPVGHCHPCGFDVLSPGESMSRSFEWDERLWDLDEERMRRAPDGRYAWTAAFYAEPDAHDACGGDRSVSARTEVEVG